MSPISQWFRHDPRASDARRLYARIVEQARQRELFTALGVPDSLDGRFEMVVLHVFLVLHRLKQEGPNGDAAALGQDLCDVMFADMDASLREMGAGDLGVGGRVKQMASGFAGRVAAYAQGLTGGSSELTLALRRNVYGTVEPDDRQVERLARYVLQSTDILGKQNLESLTSGPPAFAAIPSRE